MGNGICKQFAKCQFYKKYCQDLYGKEKFTIFHEYISVYCYGPLRDHCRRLTAIIEGCETPSPDLTPSGVYYSSEESDRTGIN